MTFIYFLLTFFLLYSGLHFYLFLKIRAAFHPGAIATVCLTISFLFLGLAPLIVGIIERHGIALPVRLIAYIGYIWMGFIVLFFFPSLILDLGRSVLYLSAYAAHGHPARFNISPLYAFFIPFIVALGINIYGYFEATHIRTEKITIHTPKLPPEVGRLRIVQVSDIHIGLIIQEGRLRPILDEIKKADPDILVSTGDLLDGEINNLKKPMELLKDMHPRYGKFAVTGNHEFYAGIQKAVVFTEGAGFKLLRGEGVTIAGVVNIAGIDDSTGISMLIPARMPEKEVLTGLPQEHFTLLLKHRPDVNPEALGYFDLQLSGHTHKGQFFPFSIITGLFFKHRQAGYYELPKNSVLYINRGAGTWGPPIRFLAPPEITIIDLIPKK
ncbi:MAG: metallophosphoesterase [Deltaproteobacteria bacterium]|nr:metallophosphoesterase [Deltaproteobacteria bacterium]